MHTWGGNRFTPRARRLSALAALALVGGLTPVIAHAITPSVSTAVALTNSSFESGDGNKTADNTGYFDWNSGDTATVHTHDTLDPPAITGTDYSFGQGAKEDVPNPNIVSGSIPPNKSDLTDFYTAYETKSVGGQNQTFLYLGWARTNSLGNANMDFEFNQNPGQTYVNPSKDGVVSGTPTRTAGDLLITFDFGGSGTPVLSMFKWTDSSNGSASDCYSANALPCWGQGTLGNLSNASVTEANAGVSGDTRFGEAGVNLTLAGAFSTSGCTTYGDALLKSRSSTSFTSEIKDFVMLAPGTISVSNCGSLKIHKTDDATPANPLSGIVFTLYSSLSDTSTAAGFTCTTDANGNCTFKDSAGKTGIQYGTYQVVETTPKAGYNPVANFQVTVTSTSGDSPINLVDRRAPAEITFTKTDDSTTPLGLKNVVYYLFSDTSTVTTDGFTGSPPAGYDDVANKTGYSCTTTTAGLCDISGIVDAGKYWLVETSPPAGYSSTLPYHITVELGHTYNLTAAFIDARKFTVITLVCVQNTQRDASATQTQALYPSKVAYDAGSPPSSSNTPGSVPTALSSLGVTADKLCTSLGTNITSNHYGVGTGSHSSSISIP